MEKLNSINNIQCENKKSSFFYFFYVIVTVNLFKRKKNLTCDLKIISVIIYCRRKSFRLYQ